MGEIARVHEAVRFGGRRERIGELAAMVDRFEKGPVRDVDGRGQGKSPAERIGHG